MDAPILGAGIVTQIWHVYGGLGTCASVGTVKQKFTLLKTQILAKCLNIVEVTNEKNNHFNSSTSGRMYSPEFSKRQSMYDVDKRNMSLSW